MTDNRETLAGDEAPISTMLAAVLYSLGGSVEVKQEHFDKANQGVIDLKVTFQDDETVVISITETAGH